MSKKTKTTAVKNQPANYPSFVPILSFEQATANFIAAQPKNKNGEGKNSCLNEFLKTAKLLTQYQSFDLNVLVSLTRGLDLDVQEVTNLFFAWVSQMETDKKIRKVFGCYDLPTWHWISSQ